MAEKHKTFPGFATGGRVPCLLLLLLLISACQPAPRRTDLDIGQAERSWSAFSELSRKAEAANSPFNCVLNVRYKSPQESQRFTAYFWGNGQEGAQPVRLDVQGAFGATAAKLFEDENSFVLYDTDQNLAYRSAGPERAMLNLGLPLPIRMRDLALLLSGRYDVFFTAGRTDPMPRPLASSSNQESTYQLAGPRRGELTLDSRGRPVLWSENGDKGWNFQFDYLEGVQAASFPGPYRLRASHPGGYAINIQLKSYNRQDKVYPPEQLDLILPANVLIKNS